MTRHPDAAGCADVDEEIAALRADLAKAREEIKRWEDKEVNRAANCCGQEERALLAERARDEAVAEGTRFKKALKGLLAAAERMVDKAPVMGRAEAEAMDAAVRVLDRTDGEGA